MTSLNPFPSFSPPSKEDFAPHHFTPFLHHFYLVRAIFSIWMTSLNPFPLFPR
jgi:hypothetical protein